VTPSPPRVPSALASAGQAIGSVKGCISIPSLGDELRELAKRSGTGALRIGLRAPGQANEPQLGFDFDGSDEDLFVLFAVLSNREQPATSQHVAHWHFATEFREGAQSLVTANGHPIIGKVRLLERAH